MKYLLLHMIFLLAAWAVQADATATQTAAEATAVLPNNELLPAPHDMAANHRTVNRAMLALLAGTSTELDATTISTLEDIAYQCPLQGGNAVYRARAFLRMFGEYSFHKVDCEEQALRRGVQSASAELRVAAKPSDRDSIADWRVYPNPTSQTLFISGGDATSLRSIRMTDLFGRVIGQWPSGTTVLHLDTNLPDGVYFLHFDEADGTTITRKVIVAK